MITVAVELVDTEAVRETGMFDLCLIQQEEHVDRAQLNNSLLLLGFYDFI